MIPPLAIKVWLTLFGQNVGMPDYVRPKVPEATIFFTVVLARQGQDMLVREIARLREAVAVTMAERPFGVVAWVVLPDHLHAIWQMPEGDIDFSGRWGAIKARFSMSMRRAGLGCGNRGFGRRF